MDYQLPYQEYLSIDEKNEHRILDILHRVIVHERKRPILHRTTTLNPVRSLLSLHSPLLFLSFRN